MLSFKNFLFLVFFINVFFIKTNFSQNETLKKIWNTKKGKFGSAILALSAVYIIYYAFKNKKSNNNTEYENSKKEDINENKFKDEKKNYLTEKFIKNYKYANLIINSFNEKIKINTNQCIFPPIVFLETYNKLLEEENYKNFQNNPNKTINEIVEEILKTPLFTTLANFVTKNNGNIGQTSIQYIVGSHNASLKNNEQHIKIESNEYNIIKVNKENETKYKEFEKNIKKIEDENTSPCLILLSPCCKPSNYKNCETGSIQNHLNNTFKIDFKNIITKSGHYGVYIPNTKNNNSKLLLFYNSKNSEIHNFESKIKNEYMYKGFDYIVSPNFPILKIDIMKIEEIKKIFNIEINQLMFQ
jgi:hypothetical protein